MSVEAMAAALSSRIDALGLTPGQRLVLMLLANGANADGECWPSIGYLVLKSGMTDRGVQKSIAELETRLLLIRAKRKRLSDGRNTSNLFTLTLSGEPRTPNSVHPTPELSSPSTPNSVHPTPELSSPPTTLETSGEKIDADASIGREHILALDRLKAAWKAVSPGRLSPVKVADAFAGALQYCDPLILADAGERYIAEDPDVKRFTTAINLHTWLAERRFEAWARPAGEPVAANAVRLRGWSGPPEVRAGIVRAKGEAFAASYLDPAGWDAERRAVLPATGVAADVLRQLGARLLAPLGVDDVDPPTRSLFEAAR